MTSWVHCHAVNSAVHLIPYFFTWQLLIRMSIVHWLGDDLTCLNPRPSNHSCSPWVTIASNNTPTLVEAFYIQLQLCKHSVFRPGLCFTKAFMENFGARLFLWWVPNWWWSRCSDQVAANCIRNREILFMMSSTRIAQPNQKLIYGQWR